MKIFTDAYNLCYLLITSGNFLELFMHKAELIQLSYDYFGFGQ